MFFNFRRFVSLTLFLSGFIMTYTGIFLYVAPHGRVAYWSQWSFWGLNKTQYGTTHTTLSLLWLIVACFHVWYNWKSIKLYLKNKLKKMVIFTKEMLAATFLTLAIFMGTYLDLPPLSYVNSFSEYIKDGWAHQLGEPPYGHAESSSLKVFCSRLQIPLGKAVSLLKEKNIKLLGADQRMEVIANENNISPQDIFNIISGLTSKSKSTRGYSSGLGRKNLGEICEKNGWDCEKVIQKLEDKNITVDKTSRVRTIVQKLSLSPQDFIETMNKLLKN